MFPSLGGVILKKEKRNGKKKIFYTCLSVFLREQGKENGISGSGRIRLPHFLPIPSTKRRNLLLSRPLLYCLMPSGGLNGPANWRPGMNKEALPTLDRLKFSHPQC